MPHSSLLPARSVAARRVALLFAIAILGPALAACTNKPSDKSLVFVSVAEGEKLAAGGGGLLGNSKGGVWVDARTKTDFDAGHIPGAISLPFEKVSTEFYTVKDYSVLIVYGSDYNDVRANGMSKRLKELLDGGDIRTLDGGVRAWTAAGNQLEAAPGAATKPAGS